MAKLYFNYGTMGSGKSLHLLATAHNFQLRRIPFLIFKSSLDTRDGNSIIHSRGIGERECITISPNHNLFKTISEYLQPVFNTIDTNAERLKWILVDECQFLTEEQVNQLAAIVDRFGVNVSCYGLRTDFRTRLFPGSKRLMEVADTIEEIKSSCDCGKKTIFNARIDPEGNIISEGEQIEIGGDERYISLCRECYLKQVQNSIYYPQIID